MFSSVTGCRMRRRDRVAQADGYCIAIPPLLLIGQPLPSKGNEETGPPLFKQHWRLLSIGKYDESCLLICTLLPADGLKLPGLANAQRKLQIEALVGVIDKGADEFFNLLQAIAQAVVMQIEPPRRDGD